MLESKRLIVTGGECGPTAATARLWRPLPIVTMQEQRATSDWPCGIHQRDLRRYLAGDERVPVNMRPAAHLTATGGLCRPAVPSGRGARAHVSCRSGEDSVIPGT